MRVDPKIRPINGVTKSVTKAVTTLVTEPPIIKPIVRPMTPCSRTKSMNPLSIPNILYNTYVLSEINKIENTRRMPKIALLVLTALLLIGYWFVRGGSFRLYASMFFGLYFITNTVWLSIILVSLIQNVAFLPLRIIGEKLLPNFKEFETELEQTKNDDQSLLVTKKIREGDTSLLVYILNFVLVAIAFISAGRVFLLDFYYEKISTVYLYPFIPYPQYPLQGTIFHFPFLKITKTMALPWQTIIMIWVGLVVVLVLVRFAWRLVRWILNRNQQILRIRIAYNKVLMMGGGISLTLFIVSTLFLRNIPIGFQFMWLSADLTRQNTTFNVVTAVATFFATVYIGYSHNREGAKRALERGLGQEAVNNVLRASMKVTLRNALFLAIFAYWLTHHMPSSHDLSVLAFESIYILAPYTIDAFIMKKMVPKKAPVAI